MMKARFLCVLWGALFFVVAVLILCGIVELVMADFDLGKGDRSMMNGSYSVVNTSRARVSEVAAATSHIFLLDSNCVNLTVKYVYAILLLTIWVPACIVASFVWPLWMMSLILGATLASDDVKDLMRCLQPSLVKKRYATTDQVYNSRNWKKNVEQPGSLLVDTMVRRCYYLVTHVLHALLLIADIVFVTVIITFNHFLFPY